jgi:ABC-type Mn2+/Zn2+ transport system ATPase subunit
VADPVVFLAAVSTSYEGERVATLHDLNLSVFRGQRVAIVGPNGAGKTTLLEVINGLLPSGSGEVRVFGRLVAQNGDALRSQIAYMPQDLFFEASTPFLVWDVVMAARYARIGTFRWPGRADRQQVQRSLSVVGIAGLARRPIGRLSGGQQRKVLLSRALAQESQLLLLDEPTANLDPEAKRDVARIVSQVEAELAATALVVTHEGGPLLEDAGRLVRIEAGRITRDGPMTAPSPVRALGGR